MRRWFVSDTRLGRLAALQHQKPVPRRSRPFTPDEEAIIWAELAALHLEEEHADERPLSNATEWAVILGLLGLGLIVVGHFGSSVLALFR